MGKSPFLSKTLWANLIAVLAMIVQGQTGFVVDLEVQMAVLGVVNIILRFVTKEPVSWSKSDQAGYARPSFLWLAMILIGGALLLTPMLFGCSALQTKSKDGLATQALLSAQAAVVGMAQAADQMCTQGTLGQSDCDQVAQIYEQAQVSYDLAADLLIVALEADTPEAWQNYQALHDRFFQLYTSLNAAAVEFKILPAIEGGAR